MAEIHFHFPEGQEISDMPINEVIITFTQLKLMTEIPPQEG